MVKTAFITGASKGIGRAIALGLAEKGYRLALLATNRKSLEEVATLVKTTSLEPLLFVTDVTDAKAVEEAASETFAKTGRIDVLVNSAGVLLQGTSELSFEDFSRMIDINLKGSFHCAHAVAAYMKRQGEGYIFNVSSRAGKVGLASLGGYSASKFGVCGLSEALFNELAAFGIKVTAICPGWVNTDMADKNSSLPQEHRIPTLDLVNTISYLLEMSPHTCIKEVVLECMHSIASTPRSAVKKS